MYQHLKKICVRQMGITYIVSGSMIDSSIRVSRPWKISVKIVIEGSSRWKSTAVAELIFRPRRISTPIRALITSVTKRVVVQHVMIVVDHRRPAIAIDGSVDVIQGPRNLMCRTSIEIQGPRDLICRMSIVIQGPRHFIQRASIRSVGPCVQIFVRIRIEMYFRSTDGEREAR